MTCSLDGAISSLSLVSDGLEAILGTTEGSIYRMMVTEEAFELGEAQLLESAHTAPISCSTVLEGASYSDRSDLVLVTGSEDGNLKLWDLSDFTSPVAYKDRACVGGVVSLTSLPSLSLLLSGWADGSIRAFDSNSSFSHPIWSIPNAHNGSVTSLDGFVSEETQFFVSGGSDGSVRFWSLHRRDMLCQFTEHTGSVSSVIIDKEKPHLVHSCDKDGMIFTFDLKIQRRTVAHVTRGLHFTDMVQRVDSEQELITSSHQGLLLSWDCDYSDPVSQVRESMAVLRLCIARSAKNRSPMLFYATLDNTVHMQVLEEDQVELGFEASSGYEGHANIITSLLCVHDNLISTDTDGCVCLWKVDG
jgi:WD40 repeat protein